VPYADDLARTHRELDQARCTLDETYMATLETLASAVDARDPNTYGHCRRVAELTSMLAQEMGMRETDRVALVRAALLHDIGKLGIPDSTLRKTTALTKEDSAEIRQHPEVGYRMLAGLRFLGEGLSAIRYHHERFDGSGYPYGLAGDRIPLMARILAVSDAYDAITSDRPYRQGRPKSQGVKEIARCSGSQFDPAVVAFFLRAVGQPTWPSQAADPSAIGQEAATRPPALNPTMNVAPSGYPGRPRLTLIRRQQVV
jgi:putative nucleotidyltransferase with HDIG domain